VLFHSLQFLLFLPIAWVAYWSAARQPTVRKLVLVVASLCFYMAWDPAPVVLLLALAVVDWGVGEGLFRAKTERGRQALLAVSIVANLGALVVFKYADWLTQVMVDVARVAGITIVYRPVGLALPLGLSFFVFQGLSYTIDLWRRTLPLRPSLLDVLSFLTFFPHVVAGPIVRADDFLPQLEQRPRLTDDDGGRALFRIVLGLLKKLAIADFLEAHLVRRVFAEPSSQAGLDVVAGVVGYSFQIYYDFSAYSDIAIGTAALFGVTLKENFDKPYLAHNLFDFWRRWHISLNTWLRDYLYIPLGGNRSHRLRRLFNIWLTMTMAGAWHGAHGRFVLWGGLHGVLLCATQAWWWAVGRPKEYSRWQRAVGILATFVVVAELRILFRAPTLSEAAQVFSAQAAHWQGVAPRLVTLPVFLVLTVAIIGHLLPHTLYHRVALYFARAPLALRVLFLLIFAIFLKFISRTELQPFIYSQF
jgi:alginate O-acetyltransferase complex protein AlgI